MRPRKWITSLLNNDSHFHNIAGTWDHVSYVLTWLIYLLRHNGMSVLTVYVGVGGLRAEALDCLEILIVFPMVFFK